MLDIAGVSFAYPGHPPVLKNISLQLVGGEFVGLAGRNGSGKTTLTRLMVGLEQPVEGSVRIDGRTPRECGPAEMAKTVGYVFQNPDRQIFRDTVEHEVAFGPEQLGWQPDSIRRAVEEALHLTGLTKLAAEYPRGQTRSVRQRIAIASALALKPRLLILDEPTSGQDAEEKSQLMELLETMNASGIGIILVTHDMELLLAHTRRVIVMHQGEIAFDGQTAELFATGSKAKLDAWGLRQPDIAVVASALTETVGPVRTVEELADGVKEQMRRTRDEKTGAAV